LELPKYLDPLAIPLFLGKRLLRDVALDTKVVEARLSAWIDRMRAHE
jgi:hypothetical protein